MMGYERNDYGEGWETFKLDSKRFLALKTRHQVAIWGDMWANYGSWQTIDGFKDAYRKGKADMIEPALEPFVPAMAPYVD